MLKTLVNPQKEDFKHLTCIIIIFSIEIDININNRKVSPGAKLLHIKNTSNYTCTN